MPSQRSWWFRAISAAMSRSPARVDGASRRTLCSNWCPTTVCVCITPRSGGVSGPGLSRMRSGIATLPMSCRGTAARSCREKVAPHNSE